MITLVVLLTCLDHVKRGGRRKRLQQLVWVAVCVVGVSRVLISSHFLHQILCGLLFGVLIHAAISRHLSTLLHSSTNSKFCAMIGVAVVMVSLALFLFHSWTRLGMDPGFSIALAKRFCADSRWVKLNTTPLFSLMRSAGTVVGVALVTALRPLSQQQRTLHSLAGLLISALLIGCLEMVPMTTEITTFYVQSLCMCAMIPLTVGTVHFLIST
jgi:hypothetical protein